MALTANALTSDRQHCLNAGMDDYISKPVSLRRLYEAVRYWLQRHQGTAGHRRDPSAGDSHE